MSTMETPAKFARAHVIVYGHVQGVFFRSSTRKKARELAITGWVRNNADGAVEAVFEGEKESVEKMIAWCHLGPSRARVDDVKVLWETYKEEYQKFNIL